MTLPADLSALDIEYARFNAVKTVADARESRFSVRHVGPLTVTLDPARGDSYYQRVIGVGPATLAWLDEALGVAGGVVPLRVDVPVSAGAAVRDALAERGFREGSRFVWLELVVRAGVAIGDGEVSRGERAPDGGPAGDNGPGGGDDKVIHVPRGDCDRILPLIEIEGPVNRELWEKRKVHQCTETFRAFAVEAAGRFVAMGTTFVSRAGAILGSAVTHPDYRRRGHHTALIQARLADARNLGLDWVAVDVESGSASERNFRRAGFVTVCEQAVWVRAAGG